MGLGSLLGAVLIVVGLALLIIARVRRNRLRLANREPRHNVFEVVAVTIVGTGLLALVRGLAE